MNFRDSAKGADARRQAAKKIAKPLGWALDAATVLHGFFYTAHPLQWAMVLFVALFVVMNWHGRRRS